MRRQQFTALGGRFYGVASHASSLKYESQNHVVARSPSSALDERRATNHGRTEADRGEYQSPCLRNPAPGPNSQAEKEKHGSLICRPRPSLAELFLAKLTGRDAETSFLPVR